MRHIPFVITALLGLCLLPSVRAQEVKPTEPEWFTTGPAPDSLPHPKHSLYVEFPQDMRPAQRPGYAIVERYIDATGDSLVSDVFSADAVYESRVLTSQRSWDFVPGKTAGNPVDGVIWMAVIFNPPSATTGASTVPRLLAVAPAMLDRRTADQNRSASPILRARLFLGADGAIQRSEPVGDVAPALWSAATEALKRWRFAPATANGRPVASELTMPVLCTVPWGANEPVVPPKLLKRGPLHYPPDMQRSGTDGSVWVRCTVTPRGDVENAYVLSSTHPAFDEVALESVRKSKFAPGTRSAKAVSMSVTLPIKFEMEFGGHGSFGVTGGDPSQLPPQFRYDTPPRVANVQVPVFPYSALRERKFGKAVVTMLVTRSGIVGDVKVLAADQPEFGLALTAAVETFQFSPALRDGKPVDTLVTLEQRFNDQTLRNDAVDNALAAETRHPERIVAAKDLDARLKPVSLRPGVFPVTAGHGVTEGSAEIDCVINEDGRVVIPRIAKASAPAFGYAAVQAVSTWRFEPPKQHGKPVMTRVRIPLDFKMDPNARPLDAEPAN